MKIFETSEPELANGLVPGTLKTDGRRLWIACANGWLEVKSLQLAGKKRMDADAFLRGFSLDGMETKM